MNWRRVLPALGLVVALSGCDSSQERCVTDNDCFFGEVCRERLCAEPVVEIADDAGADAAAAPTDSGPDSADQGRPDAPDTSMNSRDVATPPDDLGAAPDMSSPDAPTQACIVDPFDPCSDDEDPDNNDFPGVAVTNMTRGCQSSGFVPLDVTISGRQCALDPEDQYSLLLVECYDDEPGMIIEATLDVKDDCDPSLIHFDVEGIGTTCANPNPDSDLTLRCQTLADGRRQISVIWPGQAVPVVTSMRWSIQTPDRTDVQFDYDFRVVVREP